MVQAFSAYLDFCYIVRRSSLTEDDLDSIDEALERFHQYRSVFEETGVRSETNHGGPFSLPRQHSMVHYRSHIENFGAPNGLCTSITENKHIKTVKKPWRRSSKNKALGQMLLVNQRNDKLLAARIDFEERGMLPGTALSERLASRTRVHVEYNSGDEDEENGNEPQPLWQPPMQEDSESDEDDGELVMSFVSMAKKKGACTTPYCLTIIDYVVLNSSSLP